MAPIYEYSCECGNKFETRKKIEERDAALCSRCGATARKILSAINFTFGWRLGERVHKVGQKNELQRDL